MTRFRRKRSDTKVATIEATYGIDFRVRGDMKLGTLLARTGTTSLTELLQQTGTPAWQRVERAACERRGMEHVGGRGAPDCIGVGAVVEVKHHARPLSAAQVATIAEKSWAQDQSLEIVSSGFSPAARATAKRLGVKLRRR